MGRVNEKNSLKIIGPVGKVNEKNNLKLYRASVSGRMDVIYVRILLPYAENFDPGRMTYVQSLSVTPA